MSARVQTVIKDSSGGSFAPASLPHTFVRDSNGNILTDTCVEAGGAVTRVKTYGGYVQYGTEWLPSSESAWVAVGPDAG